MFLFELPSTSSKYFKVTFYNQCVVVLGPGKRLHFFTIQASNSTDCRKHLKLQGWTSRVRIVCMAAALLPKHTENLQYMNSGNANKSPHAIAATQSRPRESRRVETVESVESWKNWPSITDHRQKVCKLWVPILQAVTVLVLSHSDPHVPIPANTYMSDIEKIETTNSIDDNNSCAMVSFWKQRCWLACAN